MKRLYTLLFSLILLSSVLSAETKIIAHRGFSAKAPENTLDAFKKAIHAEADYFELDVHKTADDSIVVIHDKTIDRVSAYDQSGTVAEMSYKQLSKINVGYPDKFLKRSQHQYVPTLKEALHCAKGKIKVCIEIKAHNIEADVLKAVNDLEMNDDVIIFSFYYDVLEKVRELDPEIPILYLRSLADEETVQMVNAISGQAIGAGLKTDITPEFLDYVHQHGIELWQWTVNKEEDMLKLLEAGADGIITNHPDQALKLKRSLR